VLTEALQEILSSSDVAGNIFDGIRVITEKEINAVAVSLGSFEDVSKGCARSGEDVASPPRDVCGCDAARLSIDEEEFGINSCRGR